MARTVQGVSLADQGLFPFCRRVRCTVEVGFSFTEAERAGRICLAERVASSHSTGTASHGMAASTLRDSRLLRMTVDPEVPNARGRPGALGHLHGLRRYQRLFPEMEADALTRPLLGGRTELVLDAAYRAPGGLLGVAGDILLGRFVARSTTAAFTLRLARAMEEAAGERHCSAWASPAAAGEAA
jgi:hypothetical protein